MRVAVALAADEREEDADAEIEAVEDHIGKHREGDQARPDEGKVEHHGTSSPLSTVSDAAVAPRA